MQDAVNEVADQLGLHRQVHGHALGAQFIQFDTKHLIERNALKEVTDCLLQFGGELERWVAHGDHAWAKGCSTCRTLADLASGAAGVPRALA